MKFAKLKSNKAFTLQDAAIAIAIILLFAGTITSTFVAIYKIQADTKVDSVAALFTVQIMERIDKLGYNEVEEDNIDNIISKMRADFNIPNNFSINIEIEPDEITNELVKTVHVKLGYNFNNQDKSISIKILKIKEFKEEKA